MRRWRTLLAAATALALAGCVHTPYAVPASVAADADYLTQLGLMRGHLMVGHALLALGERAAARTHAKHPSDELYADIEPSFAERGAEGFAAELETHAAAVAGDDASAVDGAYATLTTAISRSERVVETTPSLIARVIVALLREAAAEYAVGIVDGRLENAHEYQDAYGFTHVALELARTRHATTAATDADRRVFDQMARRIAALLDMWPNLMPPDELDQDATRLHAAADDVARLALDLRPPGRF